MPANIREIKGRIKAVGNIQRITKTMQMIATARFQALQKRAIEAQAYSQKIAEVVGELAGAVSGEVSHPLLQPPATATGREVVLVITSERGLCGAYNANVIREAVSHLQSSEATEELEVVGKKGVGVFRFSKRAISKVHNQFGDKPPYDEVEKLADHYIERFVAGEIDAVRVVSMDFLSMGKQTASTKTLLPLEPPTPEDPDAGGSAAAGAGGMYEFEPDAATLLDAILPVTVRTRLFQCFNEAVVSEQIARMVAMKAATDSAGKQKKRLKRDFNRARQTAITTELSEIIGGAAALE
ncbi:MAG: ATP synthase F1 subunit gamma [Planctomycetota bacterium]